MKINILGKNINLALSTSFQNNEFDVRKCSHIKIH